MIIAVATAAPAIASVFWEATMMRARILRPSASAPKEEEPAALQLERRLRFAAFRSILVATSFKQWIGPNERARTASAGGTGRRYKREFVTPKEQTAPVAKAFSIGGKVRVHRSAGSLCHQLCRMRGSSMA